MKKLTKTQKNILKKKILRISNIVALIVGGLSFLVVLYAIIAGGINSTAPETADVSEGASSPSSLVQPALTPPSSYDLQLSPYEVAGISYFAWQDTLSTEVALFSENLATIDYYSNSYNWRDMLIITNVYAPTTSWGANEDDMFYFTGDYLGSAASSPSFIRFRISLNNRNSSRAFLFYGDFSSSGVNVNADVTFYDKNVINLGGLSPFVSYYNNPLRGYYVPPFSQLALTFWPSSSNGYLNALYFDDIGADAYDSGYTDGFVDGDYDNGYTEGYGDGMTDGYDIGRGYGYNEGYGEGTIDGYDLGHTAGYNDGYSNGMADTISASGGIEGAFDLIYAGAQSVDKILSVNIFGSITLGMLLFTPLIVGISLAVIKVIKG